MGSMAITPSYIVVNCLPPELDNPRPMGIGRNQRQLADAHSRIESLCNRVSAFRSNPGSCESGQKSQATSLLGFAPTSRGTVKSGKRSPGEWHTATAQLVIRFCERFVSA